MLPGLAGIAGTGSSSAFPIIRGSPQVSTQNNGGTFSPALPAHAIGDVLVVFCGYSPLSNSTVSASAGWTQAAQVQRGNNAGGIALFYRTAVATNTTITITNSNSSFAAATAYALQYASGSVEAASASSDIPPTLAPSWGAGQTFWFVADCSPLPPGGGPSGFTDRVVAHAGSGGDIYLATMDMTLVASSVTPSPGFGNVSSPVTITAAVKAP